MSSPGDLEKKDNFPPADPPASHDLDRALAEAAEEMDFEWPEFLIKIDRSPEHISMCRGQTSKSPSDLVYLN